MQNFTLHTVESAPKESKPLLEKSVKAFGSIPNLHAVMAEAPTLLDTYQALHQAFLETSFTDEEKTVVWQTINIEHNCQYCVPAHTAIAKSMKISDDVINALKTGSALPSEELNVLRDTTLAMVRQRGVINEAELDKFYTAGFTQQNLLEIIVGLAQKVMSNYTNHLAKTPLDEQFKPFA